MKKGNVVLDTILVIVILFILALTLPFVYQFITEYNTELQADSEVSQSVKNFSADATTKWPQWTDNAFVLILVLAWMFILVASFMIDSHPIFFVFSLILLFFVAGFAITLSNSYQEMVSTDADMTNFSINYPKTIFIMEHLGHFAVAMGISVSLVLYGKLRGPT